jgi:hypothetical protein
MELWREEFKLPQEPFTNFLSSKLFHVLDLMETMDVMED